MRSEAATKREVVADIARSLRLLLQPDQVTELRVFGSYFGTISGYFSDIDRMADCACAWNGKAEGVYHTLDPVNPALLARANNRIKNYARRTTTDDDILRRQWLLIDFDPKRPAGISSTDEEHRLALELADGIRKWLGGRDLLRPTDFGG